MPEKHGHKWRVKVRGEDGKRPYVTFETEAEARAFERVNNPRNFRTFTVSMPSANQRLARDVQRQEVTVLDYGRDVVMTPTRGQELRPNTRSMYETAMRKIEQSDLGSMPIRSVTASDVRRFFAGLTGNRDNVRAVLAKVFSAARDEGIIRVSPLAQAKIRPSKRNGKHERLRALTPDQVEALALAAGNDRDALAIRLGAYVGLRAGEVGGLNVEDVDIDGCRLHIRRNAQQARGGGVEIGDPKTETSDRSLKVPSSIVDDIVAYVEKHPPLADGTIFYTSARNAMYDGPLTAMVLKAARKAGLYRRDGGRQWPTFHKLRNTAASLLIAAKLEPKAIQEYLGHSSIRMTYDLYGDLFPKADEPIADAMGALRAAAERSAPPAGVDGER
jgi:integrase